MTKITNFTKTKEIDCRQDTFEHIWVEQTNKHMQGDIAESSLDSSTTTTQLPTQQEIRESTQKIDSNHTIAQQTITESNLTKIQEFLQRQNHIICIYTQSLDSKNSMIKETLNKAIFDSSKENRIYLYLQENNQENIQANDKNTTENTTTKHCLVRYGENIYGSFVLAKSLDNDKIEGLFFSDRFDSLYDSNHLLFSLDSKQCEDFWYYFCHCFWNLALSEKIDSEIIDVTQNNQEDFLPPLNNGFDKEFIEKALEQEFETICVRNIDSPVKQAFSIHAKNLVLKTHKYNDSEILKSIHQCHIQAKGQIDFECFIDSTTQSYCIPKTPIDDKSIPYMLCLNKTQEETLQKHIDNLDTDFAFYHHITKEELLGSGFYHLSDLESKQNMQETQSYQDSINCDRFLEKEEFESQDISDNSIKEKYPYACKIQCELEIIPFYTKSHWADSKLYQEWERTRKALNDKIDSMQTNITHIKDSQKELGMLKSLGKALDKFKRFFLGQDTNLDDIATKLQNLKSRIADSLNIENFESYYSEILKHEKSIQDSDKQTRENLNEAEAYNKWQEDKKSHEKKIADKQQQIQTKESEKGNLELEYNKITQEIESNAQKAESEKELNKLKKDKKVKEHHIQGMDSELESLNKELQNLEDKLKSDYTTFRYTPKEQKENTSTLNVLYKDKESHRQNSTPSLCECPKENLPSVGILKEDSKQRYLEIEYYEEATEAKEEAQRLNAKLCVKRQDSKDSNKGA